MNIFSKLNPHGIVIWGGPNFPVDTYIIAEIASNWEGSVSKAKKLILESKKAGASAVKFQMWRANDLYSKEHPQWKIIKKSELTFKKAEKLKKYADRQNIEFFCSAFYPEAIEKKLVLVQTLYLELLGVKKYKIASRTCLLNDKYSCYRISEIIRWSSCQNLILYYHTIIISQLFQIGLNMCWIQQKNLIMNNKKVFDNELKEQFTAITNYCMGLGHNVLGKIVCRQILNLIIAMILVSWLKADTILDNFKLKKVSKAVFKTNG